jgi:hypothetical protein
MGCRLHLQFPFGETQKIAVLSFADHKVPGGRLFKGASSQEEFIQVTTSTYATIMNDPPKDVVDDQGVDARMEDADGVEGPKSLYPLKDTELLFSQEVWVLSQFPDSRAINPQNYYEIGVISSAAQPRPQVSGGRYRLERDRNAMREKLYCIMRAAVAENIGVLVLGAFGCGVFGHPVQEVAELMKEVLLDEQEPWQAHGIMEVIIAIKDTSAKFENGWPTWSAFAEAFNGAKGVHIDHSGHWLLMGSTRTVYDLDKTL